MLKNMVSKSCIKLIKLYFDQLAGVQVQRVFLGEAGLLIDPNVISQQEIIRHFAELGFKVIDDPEWIVVEKTKVAAIELIQYANNVNSLIRNSDYISERVQLPYDKVSKVFSRLTGTTLEKYIINLKIEKAKEIILSEEFTLSEIAFMLGYSSVQYLSNQFKRITGFTVSQYKSMEYPPRIPLEQILP
ncbi:MAG: helix-turn-helix transcriptional regulator [Bacteroidetes bacterium]|nr:helix-turn-helix transcriptional regulator [Bacteroidota bacterium]